LRDRFVEDIPVSLINGVTMQVFSLLDDSTPAALRSPEQFEGSESVENVSRK
jgi:hypothetical protein